MKLKDIQNLAASVRESLAKLKPSNGLDDIDNIARERAVLREKLELLGEAETAERERLEAEEVAAKKKARSSLLNGVANKTERVAAEYDQLTSEAVALVEKLVATLVMRERVFTSTAVGLDDNELRELITPTEMNELLSNLDHSASAVSANTFGTTWRNELHKACGENKRLYERLAALVVPPQYVSGVENTGLSNANMNLAETAKRLATTEPTSKPNPVPWPVKRAGVHQVVDLRG